MTAATETPNHSDGELAVLPLRDIVVFPGQVTAIPVGRPGSVAAVNAATDGDGRILMLTQKDPAYTDLSPEGLHDVGTVVDIIQVTPLPDGNIKVVVEGTTRVRVTAISERDGMLVASVETLADAEDDATELEASARAARSAFPEYAGSVGGISTPTVQDIAATQDAVELAYKIAGLLRIPTAERMEILSLGSVSERLRSALAAMEGKAGTSRIDAKIQGRVRRQIEHHQREHYLTEQMKAIQAELGGDGPDETTKLRERIAKAKLSKEARAKAEAELRRLSSMNPMSPETAIVRNYLETLLGLPWGRKGKLRNDLAHAAKVLDDEHHGLEKVKERILEHLAVQARTRGLAGPVICLVGPPGVGKTSLARSIAKATGREYVRMALGGVRDEAEIRGHRRTYVGSMPGKILQSLAKAGKNNPLFLLDEIDKMGRDNRGDPASALLEVLDPAQNAAFADHYLEVDYDLSDVMFVMTANSYDIPAPLLDRMEVIELTGYTPQEKHAIARRHLIPEAMRENGLREGEFDIGDDVLSELVESYTREAGVRGLKREISKLMRKAVTEISRGMTDKVTVDHGTLVRYLGEKAYRHGAIEAEDQVGLVTGLAWTSVGGELLTIEGVATPGKGKVSVTGNIKDVMKESVTAATAYVRSRAATLGIKPTLFDTRDIHIHLPEGATPKDGPSAGIGMATTLVSVLTGIPVRRDVAMTGEVTLRGRVLPIGGLKEKLLAALRGGTKTVLIPKDNERDIADLPQVVRDGLEIVPVASMDEVLARALVRQPEAIEWTEDDSVPVVAPAATRSAPAVAH
jgi:ATP-dependent protease La